MNNFYKTDIEGNYVKSFATTLLMPEKAVRAKFDILKNLDTDMHDAFGISHTIEALAHIFNVSEEAMGKRLFDILPTPKGGGFPPSRENFPVS